MLISISAARVKFIDWYNSNNINEFLRKNGVSGNGDMDIYHIISMSTFDGEIFYKTAMDVGCSGYDSYAVIDIAAIHDEDDLYDNPLTDLTLDDYLDIINDHYAWHWPEIKKLYDTQFIDPDELLSTELKMNMMMGRGFKLIAGI